MPPLVGWHRATARTVDLRRRPPCGIPTSIQLTGFAIEVDPSPIWNWPHVRFGSKADMRTAQSHVCFTPDSDRKSGHFSCPGRTGLKEKEAGSVCRVRLG